MLTWGQRPDAMLCPTLVPLVAGFSLRALVTTRRAPRSAPHPPGNPLVGTVACPGGESGHPAPPPALPSGGQRLVGVKVTGYCFLLHVNK